MDAVIRSRDEAIKLHRRVEVPRDCYMHDFFASENYIVVNMHTIALNPFPMLVGLRSFTDSFSWEPQPGNLLVVIPKDSSWPVQYFDAPSRFMWHSFNAWEKGDEIIADFIGYEEPDHFIGADPTLKAVMEGRMQMARYSGVPHRYILNLTSGQLQEQQLTSGNFEFPIIHPALVGHENKIAYASFGVEGNILHSGLARIEMDKGQVDGFDFGDKVHVGEPIFVPAGIAENKGHLLAMCLDGVSGNSFVAVMDAANLSGGPGPRVNLRHHTPLSFHGFRAQA